MTRRPTPTRAPALRTMRQGLHEVYINGSAKFEGTYAECLAFAKGRLALGASAEIEISKC